MDSPYSDLPITWWLALDVAEKRGGGAYALAYMELMSKVLLAPGSSRRLRFLGADRGCFVCSAMSHQAFTIGNTSSYDHSLRNEAEGGPRSWKLGSDDEGYLGGWVWRTPEAAAAFIIDHADLLGFKASVYELKLPTGWDADVHIQPGGVDGVYNLRNDAVIVKKVND